MDTSPTEPHKQGKNLERVWIQKLRSWKIKSGPTIASFETKADFFSKTLLGGVLKLTNKGEGKNLKPEGKEEEKRERHWRRRFLFPPFIGTI